MKRSVGRLLICAVDSFPLTTHIAEITGCDGPDDPIALEWRIVQLWFVGHVFPPPILSVGLFSGRRGGLGESTQQRAVLNHCGTPRSNPGPARRASDCPAARTGFCSNPTIKAKKAA